MPQRKTPKPPPHPFRWFGSLSGVIRLVVMKYVKYPLSLRKVEDLLHERGIDICTRRWGSGGGASGAPAYNPRALKPG